MNRSSAIAFVLLLIVTGGAKHGPGSWAAEKTALQEQPAKEFTAEEIAREKEATLEELQGIRHGSANDVRDILVLTDGILVATGKGIVRYRLAVGEPVITAQYSEADGLPSNNCFWLKLDAEGGTWALCEGGVGFLPKGAAKWTPFTDKNGLAAGHVTDMTLSPDGSRVWVTSTGGLAVAGIADQRWKSYPAKNLIDVFVGPDGSKAWCRRWVPIEAFDPWTITISQLDLRTGLWTDLPEPVYWADAKPAYFCPVTRLLWICGDYAPPFLYDPATNKTRIWPRAPNWERVVDGNNVVYSDWFGQMLPFADKSGRVWFGTGAGLWEYDPKGDQWKIHRLTESPDIGVVRIVRTGDGNTIYWACRGTLAAFSIAQDKWTELWKQGDDEEVSAYEPQQLILSPDEKFLWWVTPRAVLVENLETEELTRLTDKAAPGLMRAECVRFDVPGKRVLVATPRGVVLTDYAGKVAGTLKRSACPISFKVTDFVFAPDGREVWCLQEDRRGFKKSAAVLYPHEKQWEEIPDARTEYEFYDVLFSKDGKTTWLSTSQGINEDTATLERTKGDRKWVPIRVKLPEHSLGIERFWQNPRGDELWLYEGGASLFRVKLTTGELSQYQKEKEYRQAKVEKHFTLIEDYVHDLVFTPDGKYAICSASGGGNGGITLINLATGDARNFPTEHEIGPMQVLDDGKSVLCNGAYADYRAVFDLQRMDWAAKVPGPAQVSKPDAKEVTDLRNAFEKAVSKEGLAVCASSELPGQGLIVCALVREHRVGLYLFDAKANSLARLRDLGATEVTTMKLGPDGIVWAALPGSVIAINPRTREIAEFE